MTQQTRAVYLNNREGELQKPTLRADIANLVPELMSAVVPRH